MRSRSTRRWAGAVGLAATCAAGAALAVAGFGAALPTLPHDVRLALQERAAHWAALPPAAQARLQAALMAWDRQPVADRARTRVAYAAWQALPPGERMRVDAAAQAFAALPAVRQAELRAEFDALDARERHGWLLGPALGRDYMRLQPLLAQVPEAEHAPLLRTLQAMTPAQRDMLAVLVQRTPPEARAALRAELVSTAAVHREAWLWQRLDR